MDGCTIFVIFDHIFISSFHQSEKYIITDEKCENVWLYV